MANDTTDRCNRYDICKLRAIEGKKYCILHLDDSDKDQFEFIVKFENHRREGRGNYQYFVFPVETFFDGTDFDEDVNFSHAKFLENVSFADVHFQEANFFEAEFLGDANFTAARFTKEASFYNAKFNGRAYFQAGVPSIRGQRYKKFEKSEEGKTKFVGYGRSVHFHSSVTFTEAEFNDIVYFDDAHFHHVAGFRGARFFDFTSFSDSHFHRGGVFSSCRFKERVVFNRILSCSEMIFDHAKFSNECFFNGITSLCIYFQRAHFLGHASFINIMIRDKSSFQQCRFYDRGVFLAQSDNLDADGRMSVQPLCLGYEAVFTSVIIDRMDGVQFGNVGFGRIRFNNTDLRSLNVTNATWSKRYGRNVLYEEVLLTTKSPLRYRRYTEYKRLVARYKSESISSLKTVLIFSNINGWAIRNAQRLINRLGVSNKPSPGSWEYLERSYRELKSNCESRKSYQEMSDFHYGEKEARRMNPNMPFWTWFWLWAYKVTSGYSESMLKPLIALTALILLCGWIFDCESSKSLSESIEYSIKTVVLARPPTNDLSWIGKAAYYLEMILGPVFATMFALALRQRMRR
jgi:uncharacterized protein YjbI with pentapeptide repeats